MVDTPKKIILSFFVSVSGNEEATQRSYEILAGKVVKIDPALVKKLDKPTRYNFKTQNQNYSCLVHKAMFEYNDAFYLIIYAKNYSYAFSLSNNFVRFRDNRSEIDMEPNVPGVQFKVFTNATALRFKQASSSESVTASMLRRADYTFTIANNRFYVLDSKTMVLENRKYTVVSDYDFSSLF